MRTHKPYTWIGIVIAVLLGAGMGFSKSIDRQKHVPIERLQLPEDIQLSVFAGEVLNTPIKGARRMVVGPDGHLYVSLTRQNKVVMLPDRNHDGVADEVVVVAEKGLNAPHGLEFVKGSLYVANQDGVVRLAMGPKGWPAEQIVPIISGLATGGHSLKSLKLGPDNHLYLNVGSSCNVCVEEDASRATIHRYTVEGRPAGHLVTLGRHAQSSVWASGLRNSQGFAWHPVTGAFYATNEGSDNRSPTQGGPVDETLPPEHLNHIEAGHHYGWPHCWGDHVTDPNFPGAEAFCTQTTAPAITFTSHSTPIGMTFLHHANLPETYKTDAIVALHGSWNREHPSGYKLVRVRFEQNQPKAVEDFITGWLQGNKHWGRPVDVVVGADKALYISDDELGAVYRVTKR